MRRMPTIWLGLFLILHSVKCQNHLRPENNQLPGWMSARTSTKSTARNNCQYSCSECGGCTVQFRGYILGKCDPSGACVGTPKECEDCREVIQCENTCENKAQTPDPKPKTQKHAIYSAIREDLKIVISSDPLEEAVKNIFKLLDPVPPKGIPFPRIPGPKQYEEVCIIGAGPSGIHMAQSPKNKGYKKVTIYEKSNRVGGKSYDINYRGVAQPQGTIFLTPSYFDTVVPLAKHYGVGDLIESPAPNVWRTNSSLDQGTKLTGPQFLLLSVQEITKEKSQKKNIALLLNGITRYLQLYKDLFGSFQGALMQRPSSDVLNRISGTFLEFKKKKDLMVIVPVVSLTLTSFGYGQLDDIPALYGLMWNEPRLMVAAVLQAAGKAKDPFKAYFFKDGFENIWKTIAEYEELDIHFNTDLYSVKRQSGNVILKFWTGSYSKVKVCNFLIWAAPMSSLLRTLTDASHKEYSILGSLTPTIFTANLVNMKNDVRNGPYTNHFGTLSASIDHGITSEVNMKGMMIPNIQNKELQTKYDQENDAVKTAYVVQLGAEYSNEKHLNTVLREHYTKGFNASNIEILNTISWEYFPKWSSEDTGKGRHWDVFEMQGLKNTWYAGSSVSFESVKDVLEYNNLLLRQMI